MIGGAGAAASLSGIISSRAVECRALAIALTAAPRARACLPREAVPNLLRRADRHVRAAACRLAESWPETVKVLVELLDDLDSDVVVAAACALGRLGKREAKKILIDRLRTMPSLEVIDAAIGVADAECIVLLARIARHHPDLASGAREALEQLEAPLGRKGT